MMESGGRWKRMPLRTLLAVALASVLGAAGAAWSTAQPAAPTADSLNAGLAPPPETVNRGNPRAAVIGFLTVCRSGKFAEAAYYLDLGAFPADRQPAAGPRLARRLKIVLDRTFWVIPEEVSSEPQGSPEPGLGEARERLTTVDLGRRKVEILLSDHPGPDAGHLWAFDSATVAAIDPLYAQYGFGWLGDHLPAVFFRIELGEVQLWQWIGLALLLLLGWAVSALISPRLLGALRRVARKTKVEWDDALVDALDGPLRLGLLAGFLFVSVPWLGLSGPAVKTVSVVWKLLAILFLGWLLSRWVEITARVLKMSAAARHNDMARNFIPIFARVAKTAVWALAIVVGLDTAGLHVMGLVAGLGIGGVAVAFAAQKTIENLFGSLAIAVDRPFQIGDFVKIGDMSGTVEEVGLRSTRLRTLGRTVITIPNGTLISERVENLAPRDRFKFETTIGLLYGSSRQQLEYVIDEIKKMLLGHPKVYDEGVRVRLAGFGASSIDISILTWMIAADFGESTAVAEDLNFRILDIVAGSGTDFAFPSQTLYLGRDGGVDGERARAVAEEVEQRRQSGELWIPEPPTGG